MYEFLDRLINLALPKMRDFQGVPVSFDAGGNYNLGLKEWIIFPEVDYDTVDAIRGMNITFDTTACDSTGVYELLKAFGMPFKKQSS
jgi:large subunit ribosomal protein L5